jgi:hypothetical protein
MSVAFATTLISHKNFANGSVVGQVPTPEGMVNTPAMGQYASRAREVQPAI